MVVVPVTTKVPAEIVPVVVILLDPVSIAPKPEVIEPEFNAPTVVIPDTVKVIVSVLALLVITIPVPATIVRVSAEASATILS